MTGFIHDVLIGALDMACDATKVLAVLAAASGLARSAPPPAPPVLPPKAPPVEQRPPCVCGDQCKCAPGVCPGKCPVVKGTATPAGYAPAPPGFEYRPNAVGSDGKTYPWGLFEVNPPAAAAASPAKAAPVARYGWQRVCETDERGNSRCRLVYGPLP